MTIVLPPPMKTKRVQQALGAVASYVELAKKIASQVEPVSLVMQVTQQVPTPQSTVKTSYKVAAVIPNEVIVRIKENSPEKTFLLVTCIEDYEFPEDIEFSLKQGNDKVKIEQKIPTGNPKTLIIQISFFQQKGTNQSENTRQVYDPQKITVFASAKDKNVSEKDRGEFTFNLWLL